MPEIQSPCLSCSLKNYSKDNPTCRDCNARCDYIKIIDGATTPIRTVNKRASSNKLKQAELYIQEYCEKHFINLDDLKSRRFSGGLSDVRAEIAHTLRHKHVLSMKDIGKLLGKTQQAVSMILKPKVVKPVKAAEKTQTKNTVLDESVTTHSPSPAAGDPVSVGRTISKPDKTVEEPEPDNKIFIIINFKDHPDIYEYLIKTAKTNFRKPEDHILYLINKEREGSYSISYKEREEIDEYKEALQPDTG